LGRLFDIISNFSDLPAQSVEPTAMELLFGAMFENENHNTGEYESNTVLEQVRMLKEQVSRYRHHPVTLKDNPIKWWESNKDMFPMLISLARQRLGVAGTSVPSERLFSAAGNLITAKRSCLSSDNVDLLLFLNKNL
jgi:hypothetical protein